jgi:hypothetical protein
MKFYEYKYLAINYSFDIHICMYMLVYVYTDKQEYEVNMFALTDT